MQCWIKTVKPKALVDSHNSWSLLCLLITRGTGVGGVEEGKARMNAGGTRVEMGG